MIQTLNLIHFMVAVAAIVLGAYIMGTIMATDKKRATDIIRSIIDFLKNLLHK